MCYTVKPLIQGEDALCGQYAVANAVRLVASDRCRISSTHSSSLFRALTDDLDKQGCLRSAFNDGVGINSVCRLLRVSNSWLQDNFRFGIRYNRPWLRYKDIAFSEMHAQIVEHIAQPSNTVIACIYSSWDHYSIIKNASASVYHLFDSSNHKQLPIKKCTSQEPKDASKPHWIYPPHQFFISLTD